jgi:hypothetical protein
MVGYRGVQLTVPGARVPDAAIRLLHVERARCRAMAPPARCLFSDPTGPVLGSKGLTRPGTQSTSLRNTGKTLLSQNSKQKNTPRSGRCALLRSLAAAPPPLLGCIHSRGAIPFGFLVQVIQSEGVIFMVLEYGDIDLARLLAKQEKARRDGGAADIDENFIRLYWQQMLQARPPKQQRACRSLDCQRTLRRLYFSHSACRNRTLGPYLAAIHRILIPVAMPLSASAGSHPRVLHIVECYPRWMLHHCVSL